MSFQNGQRYLRYPPSHDPLPFKDVKSEIEIEVFHDE